MADYCRQCGEELQENTRFCTACGAAAKAQAHQAPGAQEAPAPEYIEAPAASYESYTQPQQAYARQEQQSAYGQQGYAPPAYTAQGDSYSQYGQSAPSGGGQPYAREEAPHPDSPYAPVSMGNWVGVNVLMLIPVVNLIMLIVWACGGSKKINLKNYARGNLIVMAIQIVLGILVIAALAAVFSEVFYEMDGLWDYFDYMNI